jgi:UDP-N-acetylmuramate dehydrogenase
MDFIQHNVPLHDKNWFSTGGPAHFFVQPTTAAELQAALAYAQAHQLPLFVLGQGANILISDQGFDGLVIRPAMQELVHYPYDEHHELLEAGAGLTMHELIEYCLNHHLSGLEEFSGIPGTVGGSIYINLHYFEFLLEQFLVQATVINRMTGLLSTVDRTWFNFGYDQSKLMNHDYFLVNATFKLKKISDLDVAHAHGRRLEIIRHRFKRYPPTNTCGSFFRNFHDHEVTLMSHGKKLIFVAYYLDKIGVKGTLRVGDAIVSYQHANMIVNLGNATSQDIIELAKKMQELVHEQFNILPQPECQLIGFAQYPLLTQSHIQPLVNHPYVQHTR